MDNLHLAVDSCAAPAHRQFGLPTGQTDVRKNAVKNPEAVGAHMRDVFLSFDLFIDEKMRRSNRLFFKVERISLYGGDNSPPKRRFFSIAAVTSS